MMASGLAASADSLLNLGQAPGRSAVTEIAPASTFYPAENYHQDYFERNSYQPYCQYVVAPKVAKFRKDFLDRLKKPA